MLFNSYEFVLFFFVALAVHWTLPARARVYFILVASYFFYGNWDYRFLALLFISTVNDYVAGIGIHDAATPLRKRLFLLLSLSVNLGILGFFKYYNFFAASLHALLARLGVEVELWTLHVVLPVGISFYTFQSMAYAIDVYRKHLAPSRDFVTYAAFVAFFPQLVAGPIGRYERLYPQLANPAPPNAHWMRMGVFLMLQGYVKKVVIADNVSPLVDAVFNNVGAHNAGQLLEAALLFTAQIYCDFSGYTDIARGVAYFFGVELGVNFRAPLLAASITDFWRRWHISLSQWLRDYLYIPLGGNRKGAVRTYVNLMLTMLLGGLWHGADWKFVVWGGIHGALLAFERRFLLRDDPAGGGRLTRRGLAAQCAFWLPTQAAVVLAFVFFRANSIGDAWTLITTVAAGSGLAAAATLHVAYAYGAIFLLDLPVRLADEQAWALRVPLPLRVLFYTLLLLALITLSGNQNQSFIYFAF